MVMRDGSHRANDHGDGHGGLETFAADVSQNHERGVVFERDDLEEVAADLLRGAVGAGESESRHGRRGFRNEHLLQFAG